MDGSGGDPFDKQQFLPYRAMRLLQVEIRLQTQPESLAGAQRSSKSKRRIRRNPALSQDDFVDPPRRDPSRTGERILADAHRQQEFFEQHFARMDIWKLFHVSDNPR